MRCAVMMPQMWRGGMLNFGVLLSNAVASLTLDGEPVVVSFCVPEGYDFKHVTGLNPHVSLVHFAQMPWSGSEGAYQSFIAPQAGDAWDGEVMTYPEVVGGGMDLILADVWILMTGLFLHGPIIPLKPYIVYAPDFIQRVVPEIYGDNPLAGPWVVHAWQALAMQRSEAVFVTSDQTGRDATSFAGVPSRKVHRVPMANAPLFQAPSDDADIRARVKRDRLKVALNTPRAPPHLRADQGPTQPDAIKGVAEAREELQRLRQSSGAYFLWVTNSTQHKNHRRAMQALEQYYDEHQGKLTCVVCGPTSELFAAPCNIAYIDAIYHMVKSSGTLRDNVLFVGEIGSGVYRDALADAAFLWHDVLYDNGTFSVIEAARLGTRSLVSRYPQMIEIVEHFGINAELFDPWSVRDTGLALKRMERLLEEGATTATSTFPKEDKEAFQRHLATLITNAASSRNEARQSARGH